MATSPSCSTEPSASPRAVKALIVARVMRSFASPYATITSGSICTALTPSSSE
jgi:hypothetical protein